MISLAAGIAIGGMLLKLPEEIKDARRAVASVRRLKRLKRRKKPVDPPKEEVHP